MDLAVFRHRCMDSIGIRPSPKKKNSVSGYSAWDLEKNSIGTRPPLEKNSFLAIVLLWCIGLEKDSIGTQSQPKKNCFWLQYYYDPWDLEKTFQI